MAATLRHGRVPLLQTFTSSAVRLCEAALEAGVDLRGAQLVLGGEPVTAARLAPIRAAGAASQAHYGSAETGSTMAYGCLAPAAPDESHVTHDLFALVEPGEAASPDLSPRALLTTTLRPRAPLVLLNVSLGDEGVLASRDCGCPFQARGWTTHLRGIRSFEKLTAGGMTFLDVDAIRVLEEVLPARFGGGPADYQLVEDGTDHPGLVLRVHPGVGPVDAAAIGAAFLDALGRGEEARGVMAQAWRDAGLLRVERRPPLTTGTGKVLHVHRAAERVR
jgi:hypothetical protein